MDFIFDVQFHNDIKGDAGADIKIDIPQGILAQLYWADEEGKALEDTLMIKAMPLCDGKADYTLRSGIAIPQKAKKMLCKIFNDSMLEIVLPELVFTIPEEKLLSVQTPKKTWFATSDIHHGGRYFNNDANRQKAYAHIANAKPEAVFITGDITDNSHIEEFAEATQMLSSHFENIPVFVCSGNHDYSPYKPGAVPHFKEMHDFFVWQETHNTSLGVKVNDLNDRNYYEGILPDGTHVYVLNANDVNNHFEVGEAQRQWLDKKLCETESDGALRIVMIHFHQRTTVGYARSNPNEGELIDNDEMQALLNKHGNILHLSGHTHYNFDVDTPNSLHDKEHNVIYLNCGCAVWNGVNMSCRGEYYLKTRCTGQLIEFYDGYTLIRGVDFVSGKFTPRTSLIVYNN